MQTFTRYINDTATEHYITRIQDGLVYYGHHIPGHENKRETACMTVTSYNKLLDGVHGTLYPDGCTHGRAIPCYSKIIGERI